MNENNTTNEEVLNEDQRHLKVGYILLGGVGIVGYVLGAKVGYTKGLRYGLKNPVIKKVCEKIDYNEVGTIISRSLTKTFIE